MRQEDKSDTEEALREHWRNVEEAVGNEGYGITVLHSIDRDAWKAFGVVKGGHLARVLQLAAECK